MTRAAFKWNELIDGLRTRPPTRGEVIRLTPIPTVAIAPNDDEGVQFKDIMSAIRLLDAAIADSEQERDRIRSVAQQEMARVEAKLDDDLDDNAAETQTLRDQLAEVRTALAKLIEPSGLDVGVPR